MAGEARIRRMIKDWAPCVDPETADLITVHFLERENLIVIKIAERYFASFSEMEIESKTRSELDDIVYLIYQAAKLTATLNAGFKRRIDGYKEYIDQIIG